MDEAGDRVITDMELWTEVRRRVLNGELSKRAACREYDICWQTLTGYRKVSVINVFICVSVIEYRVSR